MCLPQISEEARLDGRAHLQLPGRRLIFDNTHSGGIIRGKINSDRRHVDHSSHGNVNESSETRLMGLEMEKKQTLDYTQFGVNYLLRKAGEAMVYAATRVLFTKQEAIAKQEEEVDCNQRKHEEKGLNQILDSEELDLSLSSLPLSDSVQDELLCYKSELKYQYNRRRSLGKCRYPSCDSGLGLSRRPSFDRDVDLEEGLVDLDESNSDRHSSFESLFESNDCDVSESRDQETPSHQDIHTPLEELPPGQEVVYEQEVGVLWENVETIDLDTVPWQFTDPTDSDTESEFDDSASDCSLVDFDSVEICRDDPTIQNGPAFEIVELDAETVTISFSSSAIEHLKYQLLEKADVYFDESCASCGAEVECTCESKETARAEHAFPTCQETQTIETEQDIIVSNYHCFEFNDSGVVSERAEEFAEIQADYHHELTAWGDLKKEILGLNLFEPLSEDTFDSTGFLSSSSDCNHFEKAAESDLFGVLEKFDYLNKSLNFRKLSTQSQENSPYASSISINSLLSRLEDDTPDSDADQSEIKLEAVADQQASLLPEHVTAEEESCGATCERATEEKQTADVGTITDIHLEEDLDEVDLISLVEERIPKYRLRADTLTRFAGYEHEDWVHTPALPADYNLDLSPELIKETLKYFVLCGERVSQMTRAYHDIEAVTRLLEEKERDLELAARIGQGLLEKNDDLATKIELLEEQYAEAAEKISQLRFEVSMKDSLLQVYDENYEADICMGDGKPSNSLDYSIQTLDALSKKVKTLERENVQLKEETVELQTNTVDLEAKEEKLVDDCVRHLDETNRQISRLEAELENKRDVCVNQQEEITVLMSKAISYEGRLKKAHTENDALQKHLAVSKEAQKQLTREIAELEEKYEECSVLLRETQEELKHVRKRAKPSVIHQHYGTSSFFMPQGSLAMELEKSEQVVPEGYTTSERSKHLKGVFKTAKAVRGSRRSDLHSSQSSLSTYSNLSESQLSEPSEANFSEGEDDDESMRSIAGSNPRPDDLDSTISDSWSQMEDSGLFSTPSVGKPVLGKPGIPGSNDLETALRRLAVQRSNEINCNTTQEGEETDNSDSRRGEKTPTPCNTPDSCRSSSSHVTGLSASLPGGYRGFPEKLQIVKPLEGSTTLHHWQRLAQPRIEGLFEQRPGVHNRGEKSADLAEEIYSLSDYEEDDEILVVSKGQVPSNATCTLTTARVTHPSDQYTTVSTSNDASPSTSEQQPRAKRPDSLSLSPPGDGTSTFSYHLGLATTLHERGLNPTAAKERGARRWRKRDLIHKVASWIAAPMRFSSIINATQTDTQTQRDAPTDPSAKQIPPTQPDTHPTSDHDKDTSTVATNTRSIQSEKAYMNLVAKVKELGLMQSKGDLSGVKLTDDDPINIGLNNMMSIRRNRRMGLTKQSCDSGSVFNLRDISGSALTKNPAIQPGVLTKAMSMECLANKRPSNPNIRKISDGIRPRLLSDYYSNRDSCNSSDYDSEHETGSISRAVIGNMSGQIQTGSSMRALSYAMAPPCLQTMGDVTKLTITGSTDSLTSSGIHSNGGVRRKYSPSNGGGGIVLTSSSYLGIQPKMSHAECGASKVGTGTVHCPTQHCPSSSSSSSSTSAANNVTNTDNGHVTLVDKVKDGCRDLGVMAKVVGSMVRPSEPSVRSCFTSSQK